MSQRTLKTAPQQGVRPTTSGVLQRKCACGQHTGGGECEGCRKKEKLQRRKGNGPETDGVPHIVEEVLSSPGRPLERGARASLESRLGRDFSRVRVHTDGRAAESALAVNALAYTVGRDVVFGSGQYKPETQAGRKLLTHELVHVGQQERAGAPARPQASLVIDREDSPAEREAEAIAERGPANLLEPAISPSALRLRRKKGPGLSTQSCSTDQDDQIAESITLGKTWVPRASTQVDAYLSQPQSPALAPVGAALKQHFGSTDPPVVSHVKTRVAKLRKDLEDLSSWRLQCRSEAADPGCKKPVAASATVNAVTFCPLFFELELEERAEIFLHELMHTQTGAAHIGDRGYTQERILPYLTVEERLTNADSYSAFLRQLGAGKLPSRPAPEDSETDCSEKKAPGWWPLLKEAIARAEVWNRFARLELSGMHPQDLTEGQAKYLGGATQASIDRVAGAFLKAEITLQKPVSFECEPKGGGRCDKGAATYWYAIGHFHICPAWKSLKSLEDRTVSLLTGLYYYFGLVDNAAESIGYAQLARELAAQHDPVPARAEIVGSPAWSKDLIGIKLIVHDPKLPSGGAYTENGTAHERLSADLPIYRGADCGVSPLSFSASVSFAVDTAAIPRPAPFALPTLLAEFTAPNNTIADRILDPKPVYVHAAHALVPHFKKSSFTFSFSKADTFKMHFSIADPDSGVTRSYEDSVQIECKAGGK